MKQHTIYKTVSVREREKVRTMRDNDCQYTKVKATDSVIVYLAYLQKQQHYKVSFSPLIFDLCLLIG